MAASPDDGVVGFDGAVHGVRGLWVVDASALPGDAKALVRRLGALIEEYGEFLARPEELASVAVNDIVKSIRMNGTAMVQGKKVYDKACAACHGADLKGLGPVPALAGRSPSYLMRQMFDMQQGFRKGTWTDLMKPVVANLTTEDMMNIVAYTASQMP